MEGIRIRFFLLICVESLKRANLEHAFSRKAMKSWEVPARPNHESHLHSKIKKRRLTSACKICARSSPNLSFVEGELEVHRLADIGLEQRPLDAHSVAVHYLEGTHAESFK